jgi:hypothetical protein
MHNCQGCPSLQKAGRGMQQERVAIREASHQPSNGRPSTAHTRATARFRSCQQRRRCMQRAPPPEFSWRCSAADLPLTRFASHVDRRHALNIPRKARWPRRLPALVCRQRLRREHHGATAGGAIGLLRSREQLEGGHKRTQPPEPAIATSAPRLKSAARQRNVAR